MRRTQIISVLFACMAVTAAETGSARAAWTVTGGSLPATIRIEKMGTANLKLTSEVFDIPVELTAEQVSCLATCSIDNSVMGNHSEGSLAFTGVTAMQPATCTVKNPSGTAGTIATTPLTGTIQMQTVSGVDQHVRAVLS